MAGSWQVQLGFYIEALCPYCQERITEGWMYDLMETPKYASIFDIMDLILVPWGNAKVGGPRMTLDAPDQHVTQRIALLVAAAGGARPQLRVPARPTGVHGQCL